MSPVLDPPAPVRASLAGATRAEIAAALGRHRRARARTPHARRPALALDLSSRRRRFFRHAQHRAAAAGEARRNATRSRGPRSPPSRFPPTARANGCCACPRPGRTTRAPRSSASTSPRRDRGTLCVSSQVGCTLNCTFCHTGTQGWARNLTAAEIVGQVMVARDRLGDFPGGVAPTDGLVPARRGRARGVQHRVHGAGRAALQFRACARRDRRADGRGGAFAVEAAHHRLDLRRRPGDGAARRANAGPCSRCRCTPPTIRCATSSCR